MVKMIYYIMLLNRKKKSQNSYNTMAYDKLANKLLNTLDMTIIPGYNTDNTKDEINKIYKPIKIKCKTFYTSSIFESKMHHLKQNCDSKLAIYSHIKTNCLIRGILWLSRRYAACADTSSFSR